MALSEPRAAPIRSGWARGPPTGVGGAGGKWLREKEDGDESLYGKVLRSLYCSKIRGPKETFPVLKTSDVISMYRLVIVLSGEVICSKLFIVIRYIFSGGFQGPQRYETLALA